MFFKRYEPKSGLEKIIECYWFIEDSSSIPLIQKIIPDGYTEIIFHFGDPYRICLNDNWQLQTTSLFAGQITKHFYLENIGASAILGIKFKPAALAILYNLEMHNYTNEVFDLKLVIGDAMQKIEHELRSTKNHELIITRLDSYFEELLKNKPYLETLIEKAVELILHNNGMISIKEITELIGVGERQIELLFKRFVGVPPKLFTRIIRFSYIFQLVNKNHSWTDLAYQAAYFDQSHFIKNFKNFTGENPTDYQFEEKNMANFFLKKYKI